MSHATPQAGPVWLYWRIQARRNRRLGALFAAVLLFLLAYAWLFPGLLSVEGAARFGQAWFPLALVAMGQAILMLAGGISLAVGALVSLGAVLAATTMAYDGIGLLGILAVMATGLGVGALTGAIVVWARLPAIIVTLAGSFIIGGAALVILPRPGGFVPVWFSEHLAGRAPTALLLLLLLILAWKLYLKTPLGLALYAAGENATGAYRTGLPVRAALVAAYALSGLLCTLAGLFLAAQTGSGDPVIGEAFTLNSIAATVLGGVGFLGGRGTMRGALAGSLLLTVIISVMFFLGLPPVAQYIAQGLIIVTAVVLQQALDRRAA